jgi:Carboxypeptidase regulatory-like domain
MRGFRRLALLALVCSLFLPAVARAQNASIAGLVRDASGAVLPGVTVEVSSPALIEKTRTAVTDGAGQYKIVSLLPGIYTVTFTLSGFSTYKRDGIEVTGTQTITVNGDMKVGAVAETITVTGETPLVDVQSATVQRVATKEVIDNIPSGRLGINIAALQPGMMLGATTGNGTLQGSANLATAQDVGGTAGDTFTDLSIHGSKASEQRQTIAGLSAATIIRFGESLSSSPSFTAMQEMSVDSSGADATLATGGVRMNYIPRDGGNTFKGLFFMSYANSSMQSSNYTTIADDPVTSLQARGLRTNPNLLKEVFDYNPGYGGPIMKDKLWWFATARWTQAENFVANNYPNLNFIPGVTPSTLLNNTTMTYAPDLNADPHTSFGGGGKFREQTLRLSWQVNPKNKVSAYYNNKVRRHRSAASTTAWEALNDSYFYPFSDQLVQWSSPVTNRLLLEAGIWHHQETWGGSISPFDQTDPLAINVTDNQPVSLTPGYTQAITNYRGRGGTVGPATNAAYTPSHNPNTRTNFATSYVTGSHAFKTGFDFAWAERGAWTGSTVPYGFVVNTQATNGKGAGIPVPISLNLRTDGCNDPLQRQVNGGFTTPTLAYNPSQNCPTFATGKVDGEGGLYVQDRWTIDRLTLSLGARFDWFNASIPGYHLSPSIITPNRNYDVPDFQSVRHKDFTPKMAAAWDVMGDGKTALKVNFAKYVLGQSLVASNPLVALTPFNVVLTGARNWVDNNNNFIPDCDLTNPNAQGPTATGANQQIDTCAAPVGATALLYNNTAPTAANSADEGSRYGWGVRPYSWEFSLSGQRELTRNMSVTAGYARRWFGNFLVTDDLNHTVNDYEAFTVSGIPAPPATAGGEPLPGGIYTDRFYVLKNTAAAASAPYTGTSDRLFPGSKVIDHWNGFDISLNARLGRGAILQGGVGTGRQTYDNCDIADPLKATQWNGHSIVGSMANLAGLAPAGSVVQSVNNCHVEQDWLTQIKFLGSYTVPKIEVQLGASYQNIPGLELQANYAMPNSQLQAQLGHLPPGATLNATTTVGLIATETEYYDRINQLDLRIGKILRYQRYRANISLDLYNIFNQSTVTNASFNYQNWLQPTNVIAPRLMKVSLTFDF